MELAGRAAAGPTIFSPFVPERFRTPPNVVEPENVPALMFVEPEEPEEAEAEDMVSITWHTRNTW